MTRFARAKGSKSSNERVPESATSWQDMKRNLVQINEKDQSQESLSTPEKIFKSGEKLEVNSKWSDFPDMNVENKKSKTVEEKDTTTVEHAQESSGTSKKNKKRRMKISDLAGNTENTDLSEPSTASKKKKKHKIKKGAVDTEATEIDTKSQPKQKTNTSEIILIEQPVKKSKKQIKKEKMKLANANEKHAHKEYARRKPNSEVEKIFINGTEIEISYIDGFPIKKADAERITKLRKEMISRGVPKSEVAKALKLERRKAEKSLTREKKKVCFNCRYSGHVLSECPMLKSGPDAQMSETGICFKCGSTEHTHFECKVTRGDNFKFAQCFICKEQGHIARQCPDNDRGLYPKGGSCRVCGAVTHLKKDCPMFQSEQEDNRIVAHTIDDQNIESLENESVKTKSKVQNTQKIIKF